MKSKGHLYFSAFLLLVSGYAIFAASRWSFKTGFFPLAIAIPLLVLVLIHLYLESFGTPEVSKGPAVDADFSGEVPDDSRASSRLDYLCLDRRLHSLRLLIGFPLTVPLFIFFYLKLQSEVSWIHSVALTAITWGFFYLLFQRLVHIQFEAGAIQTWLDM